MKIVSHGVGRRKEATASVRLIAGSGQIIVNGQSVQDYFPGPVAKIRYEQPFTVTGVQKYDATAVIKGGGTTGQLDALVLGISRALVALKAEYRPLLRQAGLLTRDSRTRQRRMVGMGGKARRRKQSPKR